MKRRLAFLGATLFAVGLFTGIWSAAALTDVVHVGIPHMALASHVNALIGGLWLIAVSATLEHLHYNETQLKRLFWLVVIPSWGNWAITLLASFLGVRGLNFTDQTSNNFIAALLQVVVVLPGLVGSVYWVRGFKSKDKI